MILDHRERFRGARQIVAASVVEIERGAVIDEMEAPVPDEQVRVARGTVNVVRYASNHTMRTRVRVRPFRERVEHDGAGQIVEREIEAGARPDQVLDLRVGLGPS